MSRGGSRPGAGRPKGESTTTVRIPTVLLPLVSLLCSVHRGDHLGASASFDLLNHSPLRARGQWWQNNGHRFCFWRRAAIEFGPSARSDDVGLGYTVSLEVRFPPLDAAHLGGMEASGSE